MAIFPIAPDQTIAHLMCGQMEFEGCTFWQQTANPSEYLLVINLDKIISLIKQLTSQSIKLMHEFPILVRWWP